MPWLRLNQKSAGKLKPGLAWRFPANFPDLERTDDAYAFVGLLSGLPQNDLALAWIQMDKLSHKYGKARHCESCHTKDGIHARRCHGSIMIEAWSLLAEDTRSWLIS